MKIKAKDNLLFSSIVTAITCGFAGLWCKLKIILKNRYFIRHFPLQCLRNIRSVQMRWWGKWQTWIFHTCFYFVPCVWSPFHPTPSPSWQTDRKENDPQIINNHFIFTPLEVSRAHTQILELTLLYKQI